MFNSVTNQENNPIITYDSSEMRKRGGRGCPVGGATQSSPTYGDVMNGKSYGTERKSSQSYGKKRSNLRSNRQVQNETCIANGRYRYSTVYIQSSVEKFRRPHLLVVIASLHQVSRSCGGLQPVIRRSLLPEMPMSSIKHISLDVDFFPAWSTRQNHSDSLVRL